MIRLRSLGQCVLELGESRLAPDAEVLFGSALYLVLERSRRIERPALLRLLWPEATERQGAHNLRQAMYRLRALGAPVEGDRTTIAFAAAQVEADFDFLQRAEGHVPRELLLERVRGGFLPAYAPTFSTPFREWLERQRHVINALARRALVGAIVTERGRGEWRLVDRLARVCLEVDPLNEEATLALAEAMALDGGKAQALELIDRYLREIGPAAGQIRLPAVLLRRRVAESATYFGSLHTRPIPFVGRSADIATLSRALHRAQDGRGWGLLLWGEPGIGKTRLVAEFTGPALVRQAVAARASCQASDEKRPLSAFVDLVPQLLALPGGLGCSPESMSYLRRLTEHDIERTTLSPESSDAEFLFASVRRALFDLLDAVATEEALILVIEDVQWLDATSWSLLEEILSWMEHRRILLLLTSREVDAPERKGIVQLPTLRRHLVGPLDADAAADLVRGVVTDVGREAGGAFVAWCVSAGGGNPYYLRELALHAIQEGGNFQPPGTLMDLISDRLQRLRPTSLRVLQACAILGQQSTLDRVEAVVGMRRGELLDSLDELEGLRLLHPNGSCIVCTHVLLATAALQRLSELSRMLLHRRAAELMSAELRRTVSVRLMWDCTIHWLKAGDEVQAVKLVRHSAQHLVELGMPLDGVDLLHDAIPLAATTVHKIALLEDSLPALSISGRAQQVLACVAELTNLRRDMGISKQVHTTEELLVHSAMYNSGGDTACLAAALLNCLRASEADINHRLKAAECAIAMLDNAFQHDAIATIFKEAEPILASPGVDPAVGLRITYLYHATFGDPNVAQQAVDQILELPSITNNPPARARMLCDKAEIEERAGFLSNSHAAARQAFQIASTHWLPEVAIRAANYLVFLLADAGEVELSRRWFDQAEQVLSEVKDGTRQAHHLGARAQVELDAGRHKVAEELARTSIASHPGRPFLRCEALNLGIAIIARIRSGDEVPRGDLDRAIELLLTTTRHSGHDTLAAAAVAALSRVDFDRGREILVNYLREWRRDRLPPRRALRWAISTSGYVSLPEFGDESDWLQDP